jgi:hypothetical protein
MEHLDYSHEDLSKVSDKKVSEEIPSNELVEKTVGIEPENKEFINP